MNGINCFYANENGYCDSSACHNMNVVGNIITKEPPENISISPICVKPQINWQTGEPTEEGYYLVHLKKYYYKDTVGYIVAKWERNWWRTINIGSYWNLGDEIDAWQKIEPYKEAGE